MLHIVIGSDIVATSSNKEYFQKGEMEHVVGRQIMNLLEKSDCNIFNIEAPITNIESPIHKCGACLRMNENVIKGLKDLRLSLVTLANNHIMDHGIEGLKRTTSILGKANISYLGVGKNIQEAAKGKIIEKKGIKIGIYACAEHEFSIADESIPGVNPFDSLESLDHIIDLKKRCDYLVVLYHGGQEFYRYPSPNLQRKFHKMAEKGADIIIAQHTHCIGCYEKYKGAILVYGQGNFIFDGGNDEYWNSGLLLDIDFTKENYIVNWNPFIKKRNGCIEMAENAEKENLLNSFFQRSVNILDKEFVKLQYTKFVENNFENILRVLHGNNFMFKVFNKLLRGGLVYKKYTPTAELGVLNMVECEPHRELIITALKERNLKEKF